MLSVFIIFFHHHHRAGVMVGVIRYRFRLCIWQHFCCVCFAIARSIFEVNSS